MPYYGNFNNGYNGNVILPGSLPVKGRVILTPEQIEMLRNQTNKTDWKITEVDLLKAKCTHKNADGTVALTEAEDGKVRCPICGATFRLIQTDLTDLQMHVDSVVDILQTIKTLYLDAPEQLAENYFQVLPLLEKVGTLYKKAIDNIAQHNGSIQPNVQPNQFMGEPNAYQMMNGIVNSMSYNYGYGMPNGAMPNNMGWQQPVGGYVNAQGNFVPNGYGNPNTVYGNPNPGYNAMTGGMMPNGGYGAQQFMNGGQPVQQPTQQAPNVPIPPVQQGAQPPVNNAEPTVVQQKTYTV